MVARARDFEHSAFDAYARLKALHDQGMRRGAPEYDKADRRLTYACWKAHQDIGALNGHDKRPETVLMSEIAPVRTGWLWFPYLPHAKITLLEGDPGEGKSSIVLSLVSILTRGSPFPVVSEDHPEPAATDPMNVLLLVGEDGLADTVRPRLDAAGADPSKVVVLKGSKREGSEDLEAFTLREIETLRTAILERQTAFVVVDPLNAYLDCDAGKPHEIRPVMQKLALLCDETGATLLLIRHLRKAEALRAMYRGQGAIDISGAARSILLAGKHPDSGQRALVHVKCNVAALGPSQGYSIVSTPEGSSRIMWTGQSDISETDLMAPKAGTDSALEEAKAFLLEELAAGPSLARTIQVHADQREISEKTLKRAKKALGVQSHRKDAGWTWSITSKNDPH